MAIQFMTVTIVAGLVGIIARKFVQFRLAAKTKAYDAKKFRARIAQQLGSAHAPSWLEIDNRPREFFAGVHRLATNKGVPHTYTKTVLGKEVNVRRLFWYVGALEDQGASWLEQQMAVADQVVDWWAAEERALQLLIE
jgi:hypothetical protein